jgi:pentapeptide MXKDX repeat protein
VQTCRTTILNTLQGETMKKIVGSLMLACMLAAPMATFAQDTMKKDDTAKKDEMKKEKKEKKEKKKAEKKEKKEKKDEMKKDDSMKKN